MFRGNRRAATRTEITRTESARSERKRAPIDNSTSHTDKESLRGGKVAPRKKLAPRQLLPRQPVPRGNSYRKTHIVTIEYCERNSSLDVGPCPCNPCGAYFNSVKASNCPLYMKQLKPRENFTQLLRRKRRISASFIASRKYRGKWLICYKTVTFL